jgi:hypothetical protein
MPHSPGALTDFFDQIRNAGVPGGVTTQAYANSLTSNPAGSGA